ncbi:asparagine synthase C-terminal domain-containing protein [Candidatus Hodarchaeum mangrovi]
MVIIITIKEINPIDPFTTKITFDGQIFLYFTTGEYTQDYFLYTDLNKYEEMHYLLKQIMINRLALDSLLNLSFGFIVVLKKDNALFILTDRFGKLPLFFVNKENFFMITTDLHKDFPFYFSLVDPRQYFLINVVNNNISLIHKPDIAFGDDLIEITSIITSLSSVSESLILEAVREYHHIGLLYSGGVDSSTIAYFLKKNKISFKGFCVGTSSSSDVIAAKKGAELLEFPLSVINLTEESLLESLELLDPIIQPDLFSKTTVTVPDIVSLEVGLVLYHGIKQATYEGCDVILSAIGTEELFMGWSLEPRHFGPQNENKPLNDIFLEKLFSIHQRDTYRNYRLSQYFKTDLKTPFIATEMFNLAMRIPIDLKIKNGEKKFIWRKMAENIGLPYEIAHRKNKATQFGSNTNKILEKVAKKNGFRYKKDFIAFLRKTGNIEDRAQCLDFSKIE